MKFDELKRIAEENNYEFSKELDYFCFKKRNHTNNIDISGDVENKIWISMGVICDDEDFNMIKASVKFAETPIDEREEEKKYYLRHRWIEADGLHWYLSRSEDGRSYEYSLKDFKFEGNKDKEFTLSEIEEIKKQFNTDLSDFELVEVEE